MIARFFITAVVVVAGATGPWWLFAGATLLHLLRYQGFEPLIVAALIDAYFGYGSGYWPIYTSAVLVALVVVRFWKPYLSLYNR
jgi:hypothetical protein